MTLAIGRAIRFAVTSAAYLGLLAAIAVILARQWWLFELVSHFRLQLGVVLLVCGVVLLAQRKRTMAFLLAIASMLMLVPIRAYLLPDRGLIASQAIAAQTQANLRIMTANVLSSNDQAEAFVAQIQTVQPDVLVIVEHNDIWQNLLLPIQASWPHQIIVPHEGNFGIAVYSQAPFSGSQVIDLDGTAALIVQVPLSAANESEVATVIAVHLVPPVSPALARQRNSQLSKLADIVINSPEYTIVTGDLNLTPFSPYFTTLVRDTNLRDARRGRGPDITWPAYFPLLGIAIDHCLVSREFTVMNYRRLSAIGSDHFPLVVDLMKAEQ